MDFAADNPLIGSSYPLFPCRIRTQNVGFEEGGKPEVWRKTLGARTRTNNKLNPRDTRSANRTQATMVGGERSRICAITSLLHPLCTVFDTFPMVLTRRICF